MVGSALVIDGRAMADFRVHRNLMHAAVILLPAKVIFTRSPIFNVRVSPVTLR